MRRTLTFALLLLSATLTAQEKLVETIEVRVTNIDVVVTDKKGNPVSGLTKEDFELFDNNKQQIITNFYEVRPRALNVADRAISSETTYVEPPAEMRQRRIIFFIDNYSLHPFRRNEIFRAIEKFIDRMLQPGDEGMIVAWNRGLKVICPFTSDRLLLHDTLNAFARKGGGGPSIEEDKTRLRQAIQQVIEAARAQGGRAGQGNNNIELAYQQCISMARAHADNIHNIEKALVQAMSTMMSTLAGVDGKKVMVFAGAQLPERPGLDMFQYVDTTFSAYLRNLIPVAYREASQRSMALDLERLAKKANHDGVTMYMIDGGDPSRTSMANAATNEMIDVEDDFNDFVNTASSFATLAHLTGGISLTRANNFDHAFSTVARDLDAYYSLGYRPSDEANPNRNVTVKVKHPDLRVRSRRSYGFKTSEQQVGDRVIANMFHRTVKSEMPITLRTGAPKAGKRNIYSVPIEVRIPSDLTLLPNGNEMVGGFDVFIAISDGYGGISDVMRQSHPVRIKIADEKRLRSMPIVYVAEVRMRRGENVLSVAVVDQISSSSGFARTKVVAR